MIESTDKIFKFILKCCRNHNKPDLHTFFIDVDKGKAYVECREHEVYIALYFADDRPTAKWSGTPIAAANRLDKYGAIYETIEM